MEKEKNLTELFNNWSDEKADNFSSLLPSGSAREYYRIKSHKTSAIGVFNPDKKENIAFLYFSKHFLSKGLKVPEIYSEDLEKNIYLIQDLGEITLFTLLNEWQKNEPLPKEIITYYKKVIGQLPHFQITASKDLDYSVCYPRAAFDLQSMMWDLNYFKYYFLKLAKVPFDEQYLEDDFRTLCAFLLQSDSQYFLYRDFQSRNVMIFNEYPYFIDYQGGRKGALQYDIASLLYDAKADIPQSVREELLNFYIETLNKVLRFDEKEFIKYYYGFVLIRILQAMGAYGYRGFYERKEHFLQSIPYSLNNLNWILENISFPVKFPKLLKVLKLMVDSGEFNKYERKLNSDTLLVSINSFSYFKGIPEDETGNGGGFVFDCRGINNPGRYEQFRNLTGKDKEVAEFLKSQSEISKFLNDVYSLVDRTIVNYQERMLANLMVSFGCTGGQHRSVYCAEQLAVHLKEKFNIKMKINHRELNLVEIK
jgi:aminoglycoside/choline kinase family phosphotransferase